MKYIFLLILVICIHFCASLQFNKKLCAEETSETSQKIEFSNNLTMLNLKLSDCFSIALKNNFDIQISQVNPDIGEQGITAQKSRFDPVFKVNGQLREDSRPINSQLVGGIGGSGRQGDQFPIIDKVVERPFEENIEFLQDIRPSEIPDIPSPSNFPQFFNDSRSFTATIETLLPTGAIFGLEYNFVRSFVDPNPFNAVNPASTSYMEARITQPLLKDFGIFKTRSPIYIARNNKKISLLQFKKIAIDVMNLTQTAYWNLVKAIEDLTVAKVSLERANDLLEKNRIQVEIGTLAPIELVQAEEGVAAQEELVIIAENSIKDREDELKQVMNFDNSPVLSNTSIIPSDKAIFTPVIEDLDESIKIALENRPDYIEKKLELENANIKIKQTKNDILPRLDLVAGVRYSGLGSDFDDSNDGLFSEEFQGEFFGLNMEVPIGLRAARSNHKASKLQARQAQLNISKKEQEVVVQVRKAVRQIRTNTERIKATKKARELAQKRLEAEEKKYEVGRSTSLEVLRAQERLAIAERNRNKAIIDYNISLKNLDAAQGTIVKNNEIIIEN